MPTLNWIGKDKIVNLHLEVPYRVLEHKYGFRSDDVNNTSPTNSGNKIIHGDNLGALKSLLPEYEGRINCIYFDPPYNTGNEGWIYNDNVSEPHIKKWLGEVVGKEGEDLTRHDKWVCMMYPRLALMGKLISFDGVIAISIGYQEVHSLYWLCKSIFPTKQVVVVTIQTSGGKPSEGFNYSQEYLVFVAPRGFSPNPSSEAMNEYSSPYHAMTLAGFNQVSRPNQVYPIYIRKDNGAFDHVGKSLQDLIDEGSVLESEKASFKFDYNTPDDQLSVVWPVTKKGDPCAWRLTPESFKKDWDNGFIKISPAQNKKNKNLYSVQYLADGIKEKIISGVFKTYRISEDPAIKTVEVNDFTTGGVNIPTIWTDKKYYTERGSTELTRIFGKKDKFPYPKPKALVMDILRRVTTKDSLILDSFAGSGTTGQATLELNKEDGGNRKFILVEMMDYADSITAERIKRVMSGYPFTGEVKEEIYSKKITPKNLANGAELLKEAQEEVERVAGQYTQISKPTIKDNCLKVIGTKTYSDNMEGLGGSFDFYELGEPLFTVEDNINEDILIDKIREYVYFTETGKHLERSSQESKYLLDTFEGTGYYLYFEKGNSTCLSKSTIGKVITERAEQYIVYADSCTLSDDFLSNNNITFKKIPSEIRRF